MIKKIQDLEHEEQMKKTEYVELCKEIETLENSVKAKKSLVEDQHNQILESNADLIGQTSNLESYISDLKNEISWLREDVQKNEQVFKSHLEERRNKIRL